MKKLLVIVPILCCILLWGCTGTVGKQVTAVTTDSNNYTEFDKYLMETIGIEAVPAHLFLINGRVVNKVDYGVTPREFNQINNLREIVFNEEPWEDPIKTTDGSSVYMKDFDVVYITRSDCEACKTQNEEYEPKILDQHKELNILIYHILSEKCELGCE